MNVPEKNGYTPIAFWPENLTEFKEFAGSAKVALSHGKGILLQNKDVGLATGEPSDVIASPLFLDDQLYGVIVIQMSRRIPAKQQAVIQQLEGAACSFAVMIMQRSSTEKSQLVTIVELVASCLDHERFQVAAADVMTDLTTRLSCDRVSIGFLHDHGVTVAAVSHSGSFDRKSNLIRDIGEAMHEAMDQNSTIIYPGSTNDILLKLCHSTLVEEHRIGTVLTAPFAVGGKISGAVLAERPSDRFFNQATSEQFQHIVSMIGPILEVRYRDEQWLPLKIRNAIKDSVGKFIGPGHIALKFGFAAIVMILAFLMLTSAHYRIRGDAKLEARTQRVIVAPQDGFVADTNVRPGDIIHRGDILGSLDDKDLKLGHLKWSSQLGQLQKEYRDALARHDRSKVSIINAKILQSKAQLNLVGEQISRTRFIAPFDGIIVSGDLSQDLGSPVARGQVLFTVAPLVAYRVVLKVDECDIGNVKEGQLGSLILASMPRKSLLFTVEKITPVSIAEEGRNYFQVEAKIKESSDLLRPGMEGVAKINIDRRKIIWIWSHKLVDWIRLTLWSILP